MEHGGDNMMIWGSMAYNGTGNIAFIIDTMTATKYIEVLRDNLPLIASLLGLSATYHFQQDNDPSKLHGTQECSCSLMSVEGSILLRSQQTLPQLKIYGIFCICK